MNLEQPLLVFGAIADIQYEDFDDGIDFPKTRYYRHSLKLQEDTLKQWKKMSRNVEFILQLGDTIDGFNKRYDLSESSSKKTLGLFNESRVYHVIGNHELYNFSRADLFKTSLYSAGQPECQSSPVPVNQNNSDMWYYTLLPHSSLRIIALDLFEISALGWSESSSNYQEAMSKYLTRNPNIEKNSLDDLSKKDRKLVMYNGAVGYEQLKWLEQVLTYSDKNKENVILMGHTPIHPLAGSDVSICWNDVEILSVLHKHKSVLCYLTGHDHKGGSAIDDHGIQHITLPAVLETPPGEEAPIATGYLYNNFLFMKGQGALCDFNINLPFPVRSLE